MKKIIFLIMVFCPVVSTADLIIPDLNSTSWILYDEFSDYWDSLSRWDYATDGAGFIPDVTPPLGVGNPGYCTIYTSNSGYSICNAAASYENTMGIRGNASIDLRSGETGDGYGQIMMGVELLPDFSLYLGFYAESESSVNPYYLGLGFDSWGNLFPLTEAGKMSIEYGREYNLAILIDGISNWVFFYVDGNIFTAIELDSTPSINEFYLRGFTHNMGSEFKVDDFYVAVPEPMTLLLLGLGGLFIQRRTFDGGRK